MGFIVTAAVLIITIFIYAYRVGGDYYILLTDVLAAVLCFAAIVVGYFTMRLYGSLKTLHGKALSYFIIGLSLWFLAETLWLIYGTSALFLLEELRFLGYIPLALGFHTSLLISDVKFKYTRKRLFMMFIIFITFAVMYLNIVPVATSAQTLIENIMSNGYIIADFVLLFGMFSLVKVSFSFKKGYLSYGWIFMALAFTSVFIFNVYFALKPFYYGDPIEIAWLANYIFLSYGFFYLRYSLVELRQAIKK